MIPEIAHFSLILATVLALFGTVIPVLGVVRSRQDWLRYAWPFSYCCFGLIALSTVLLGWGFLLDDFSVRYIAQHSNSQLPMFFKLAAVWGGHEGSLLFWVLALSGWTVAVARCCQERDEDYFARVLVILMLLVFIFGVFVLLASNPFVRMMPAPLEGRDLNPMLQDIGLILHPPMLYLGYVGFAVSFAFATAALTTREPVTQWAVWCRPWTLGAWICLTAGIGLGSWWAYYELGWGGWWFWDPVENASLMPWLTGTALVHALLITAFRQALVGWSLLLAIFTFSLSVLGTFVVRSGVLTSVHAFAVDPARGLALLAILSLILIVALVLFALRAEHYFFPAQFGLCSKEAMVLIGNSLLAVVTLTVLLGTFYPMVFQALGLGNISVGAPYFNAMFIPLSFLVFTVMGFGVLIRWHKLSSEALIVRALAPMSVSVVMGVALSVLFEHGVNLTVCLAFSTALWVSITAVQAMLLRLRARKTKQLKGGGIRQLGMVIAHLGVAVSIIGAVLVSHYEEEISGRMGPGDLLSLGHYQFIYDETALLIGPNYTAEQARIQVRKNHEPDAQILAVITPERRHYSVRTQTMSEPGIHAFWHGDMYISLGEKLNRTDYAVRIQYKPFIRWLWLGGLLMMTGGTLAICSCRRQRAAHRQTPSPVLNQTICVWQSVSGDERR